MFKQSGTKIVAGKSIAKTERERDPQKLRGDNLQRKIEKMQTDFAVTLWKMEEKLGATEQKLGATEQELGEVKEKLGVTEKDLILCKAERSALTDELVNWVIGSEENAGIYVSDSNEAGTDDEKEEEISETETVQQPEEVERETRALTKKRKAEV